MDPQVALKRVALIQYAVLRSSLNIVEEQLVQRCLGEESAARQSYERALRRLDEVVGPFFDQSSGRADPPSAEDVETSDRSDDEAARIETLTEELVDQQDSQTFAGELAEDDELRRVQAELKAKHLVEDEGS